MCRISMNELTTIDVDNHYDDIMSTRIVISDAEIDELLARYIRTFDTTIQRAYENIKTNMR